MKKEHIQLTDVLQQKVQSLTFNQISDSRKTELKQLIEYIKEKYKESKPIKLNFICTHNSRRSQLAQIWAQTAADFNGIDALCFSGGVEVTEFNKRAVKTIKNAGFHVSKKGKENPVYFIFYSEDAHPISAFSKKFDDAINATTDFAAIMTCSHADENCPFIPGAEKRISLQYEDPKEYDGTPEEKEKYEERSNQIANEMFFVFSKIRE